MKEVKRLKAALREHLPMNAARFHCLISIIIAVLKVRTVNLVEIADGLPGKSKKESKYKRIQRLFQSFSFDYTMSRCANKLKLNISFINLGYLEVI